MVDNDQIAAANAIILLQGDGFARLGQSLELYRNGLAPKIVFSGGVKDLSLGSYPFDLVAPELLKMGMNHNDLLWESRSRNTRQQALEIMSMCKEEAWDSIILVASHFHQYRAFLTFLKAMEEVGIKIMMHNAPARDLPWFQPAFGACRIDSLAKEFEKIALYGKNGHVASFDQGISYLKWKEQQSHKPN